MKISIKTISILVLSILILGGLVSVIYWDKESEKKNTSNLIGTYIIDVNKTKLGNYQPEVNKFKKLILMINSDYTFKFNMKVPFIYDSLGKWKPAGSSIDEWNTLYYKSRDYSAGNSGDHISRCCSEDNTIYMNSTTPQKGQNFIGEIWFTKILSIN